jgi:hypothetical protein
MAHRDERVGAHGRMHERVQIVADGCKCSHLFLT